MQYQRTSFFAKPLDDGMRSLLFVALGYRRSVNLITGCVMAREKLLLQGGCWLVARYTRMAVAMLGKGDWYFSLQK